MFFVLIFKICFDYSYEVLWKIVYFCKYLQIAAWFTLFLFETMVNGFYNYLDCKM